MKLQFDKDLEYQQQAIASIVDLFRGQTTMQTNFTVSAYKGQVDLQSADKGYGIGNRLEIDEEDMLENLQAIQLRNGLPQTKILKQNAYDFDVDMETGECIIIVTGCINALVSRVSGIFIENKSCIA